MSYDTLGGKREKRERDIVSVLLCFDSQHDQHDGYTISLFQRQCTEMTNKTIVMTGHKTAKQWSQTWCAF